MQSPRVMFLNHNSCCAFDFFRKRFPPLRFSRFSEIAFAFVLAKAHWAELTTNHAKSTALSRAGKRGSVSPKPRFKRKRPDAALMRRARRHSGDAWRKS